MKFHGALKVSRHYGGEVPSMVSRAAACLVALLDIGAETTFVYNANKILGPNPGSNIFFN